MKSGTSKHKHTRTDYIQLNVRKCKACWGCIEKCPNGIINKIDLLWHKHARIVKPDECTGCLSCISICPHDAYSLINSGNQEDEKQ